MQDFITVTMLNAYIANLLERDSQLQDFWIKGEISGYHLYQQSGHAYFTLKDKGAAVSCVMFRSRAQGLAFQPEDGMEVLIRGNVSIYARQGKYQLYVEEIQPYGVGGLFLYLEQLKTRLAAEGYFAAEHKQPIPPYVTRLGVVTSQDGAAFHDILRVVRHRHPITEVILAHSSVQGPEAPRELAQGVQLLNEYDQVDVIIVARGGGSLEDLMAFNSEELVKAIYSSRIPVISGVGHEVDTCLCDLAADLRAATPTQAAQFAVPERHLLERQVAGLSDSLVRVMQRGLSGRSERLDRSMMKRVWWEPGLMVKKQADSLGEAGKRLRQAVMDTLKEHNHRLAVAATGLDKLSPLRVMARGYAILTKDAQAVKDIDQVAVGDELRAEVSNGRLQLVIKDKEKVDRWQI